MTNEFQPRPIELTGEGINPTLRSEGNIFMADGGIHTEGNQPSRPNTAMRSMEAAGRAVSRQAETPRISGTDAMLEGLTPAEQRDAQKVMSLIREESQPFAGSERHEASVRHSRIKPEREEVIRNASLDNLDPVRLVRSKELVDKDILSEDERVQLFRDNAERIAKAEELLRESLGRKLTDAEKIAILKAHFTGDASVYNVPPEQLAEKARILKEAGFDHEQRREIIESGLAAPPSPTDLRNQAIENLATFPLRGRMAEIRDRIVALHRDAIKNHLPGISSEDFQRYSGQFGELPPSAVRVIGVPQERELYSRLRHILELEHIISGGRDDQDVFNLNYDLYKQELDAAIIANTTNPGTIPQATIDQLESRFNKHVMDFAGGINPSAESIRDNTLKRVIQSNYEPALDLLVFRIVGEPFQSETQDYSLGFYGGINIDAITNLLQTLSQNPRLEGLENAPLAVQRERMDLRKAQLGDVSILREGAHRLHEINKLITTNQLEAAKQMASSLLPEYLQRLEKTKAVGTMLRLMDSGHLELLSKDGYIKTENYREMMATSLNQKTGKFEIDQSRSLPQELVELIETLGSLPQGMVVNDLEELKGMRPWEIDLAFNLARNLYNAEHRSAELSSWGRIPKGMQAFAATVFGGFRNIFNPANYVLERFKPGKDRGGYRWFERFMDSMQRRRGVEGYGEMGLEKIKGDRVRIFELPFIAGIRGYISSWKGNEGWLKQTESVYQPTRSMADYDVYSQGVKIYDRTTGPTVRIGIGHLLDTDALTFENAEGIISWGKIGGELNDAFHADFFRSIFFKPGTGVPGHEAELRDDLQVALGTIYKVSLNPSGGHAAEKNKELNLVKEQIRTLIWQRVARDNPLAVLPYLHGLKYSDKHTDPRMLKTNAAGKIEGKTVLEDIYNTPGWLALHRKLTLLNEIKLAKNRGFQEADGSISQRTAAPELSYTLQQAAIDSGAIVLGAGDVWLPGIGNARIALTQPEIELLKNIETEGILASKDMANVRYAFIPFVNDLLNNANFLLPGPNSYERHFGDIAQISGSTNALNELMENLGLVKKYEDMVEFIMKFTKGIVAVHGDAYAKEKAAPVIEATYGFFRRGENTIDIEEDFIGEEELPLRKRIARWFKQQDEFHVIAGQLHKPQSEAQMFYNSLEVLALDRKQTHNASEKLKAAGLMGRDEEKWMRKRFGGFLGFLFRMFIEDLSRYGKIGLFVVSKELLGSSFKGAVE